MAKYKKLKFTDDYREKNPGLHHLYTMWAINHLHAVDKMMTRLGNFANTNTDDILYSLVDSTKKLVSTNAAYFDAWVVLKEIKQFKYTIFENEEDVLTFKYNQ